MQLTASELIPILKALAEPNRLAIFDLLMAGASCNCELKEKLGLAPNLLSHHLRVLQKAGLVDSRRDRMDGRWIYYAVDQEMVTACHHYFRHLLNPERIQKRPFLCGPEGQNTDVVALPAD